MCFLKNDGYFDVGPEVGCYAIFVGSMLGLPSFSQPVSVRFTAIFLECLLGLPPFS